MAASLEHQTIRKIAARLLPLLVACYFAAFLDRVNVSFAALTMNADLGPISGVLLRMDVVMALRGGSGCSIVEALPSLILAVAGFGISSIDPATPRG